MYAVRGVLDAYRRGGADPPFGDPRRDHEAGMEGYYWRFTDPERGRVVVALCGLCRSRNGPRWALVALAVHPGGAVRSAIVDRAAADRTGLGVRAGDALVASERAVRVELPGGTLDVEIDAARRWPRALGGSGPAHLVPGLPQYWHPHMLGGVARGEASIDGGRVALDGATAYAEKHWGPAFAGRWWWGQADAFDAGDVCVAFAGGPVRVGGAAATPTALVVRVGDRLLRLAPPFARMTATMSADGWRVRARSARHAVELEGEDPDATAVTLPVPVPDGRTCEPRSRQALAGRVRLVVRRGASTVFRGESPLAGLERDRACG